MLEQLEKDILEHINTLNTLGSRVNLSPWIVHSQALQHIYRKTNEALKELLDTYEELECDSGE